jgi:hypothetical protein
MTEQNKFITKELKRRCKTLQSYEPVTKTFMDEKIINFERLHKVVIPSIWKAIILRFGKCNKLRFTSQCSSEITVQAGPQVFQTPEIILNTLIGESSQFYKSLANMLDDVPLKYSPFKLDEVEEKSKWLHALYSADQAVHFFVDCDPKSTSFGQVAQVILTEDQIVLGGYTSRDFWVQLKEIVELKFLAAGTEYCFA